MISAVGFMGSCGLQGAGVTAEVSDLLQQIQNAPSQTIHRGTRKVESFYNHSGKDDTVSYREEVITDGLGQFTINPLEVLSSSNVDSQTFQFLLKSREGFNGRYRDFLVRDLLTFLDNYELRSWGRQLTVAGRDCYLLDVTRKDGSSSWEVAMDIATGIVLSYHEYDGQGRLYSSMVYESVDFNPDLTGVTFHQGSNIELDLMGAQDPVVLLGFDPLIPKLLPDSAFRFVSATGLDDGNGGIWAKLEYTDGVQTILYLDCGLALPALAVPVGVFSPAQGMEEKLQLFRSGPVTVLQGSMFGHEIIAVGKVPQLDLQLLVESAIQ
ncbi:MAG: negative regulator of sigma E activity [Planctomycetota bacterium]|jgi:negative regulator of sigma E activity